MGRAIDIPVLEDSLRAKTMDPVFGKAQYYCQGGGTKRGRRICIDLSHVNFVDPYGLTGLWGLGRHLKNHNHYVSIRLPSNLAVQTYLFRMGFFKALEEEGVDFEGLITEPSNLHGESDVLLEMTPINEVENITAIIQHILNQVSRILRQQLGYTDRDVANFSTTLAEACQNVFDHSGDRGMTAVQCYTGPRGRKFVIIGVVDCGCGIRDSLAERYREAAHWDHRTAILMALRKDYSRFPDRGLGLYRISQIINEYQGSLHIRSGDTRLHLRKGARSYTSGDFPGTQLSMSLSEPLRKLDS
jgi:anti-sigma regulatory factor (Ser/Thr protein kinase)